MKRQDNGQLVFSPSDLITFFKSPFASWMDRWHLENPDMVKPDEKTDGETLITQAGDLHERAVLNDFKLSFPTMVEIPKDDPVVARAMTLAAIVAQAPVIYQAALENGSFAGYADFLELNANTEYQVWDTKLARSTKPYYAIQLCCYSEMLAAVTGKRLPERFGIILGAMDRVAFRIEDFMENMTRKPHPAKQGLPLVGGDEWSSAIGLFSQEQCR